MLKCLYFELIVHPPCYTGNVKNLLFDIDYTLLNTTAMVRNLIRMIAHETGMKATNVKNCQNEYISQLKEITHFDFIEFIRTLPVNSTQMNKVENLYLSDTRIYSKYPNVDKVLNSLCKVGYKIGIYSEGTPHFQENKLKNLELSNFLDPSLIFITQNKRSKEYIEALPPSIIIDDNADICNIVASHKKHKIIYLRRENKKFTTEKTHEIKVNALTIHSLEELLDIL